MPEFHALATAVLAAAAVGMPCGTVGAAASSAGPVGVPAAGAERVEFRFEDSRISESSGLALSVRHPHTVWTVNDSGDTARVFAVDTRTGATVGVHTFDTTVHDVEALAVTPQGRMLVADIGDNGASRDLVRVLWFDEPELGTTSGSRSGLASWELRYPDGPHDAEALAVDPRSGRVVVVTKGRPGSVYVLPVSPSRQGTNRLNHVGAAPSTVTDAVFLPDGSALAVRTYTSLRLLDPRTWTEELTTLLPLQPQGESLAVAPGGKALLVGSEGRGSRVQQVAMPQLPGTAGPTTSSPGSSPTSATTPTPPTRTPESGTDGEDPAAPSVVDRGELAAGLGACVGLVLLAVLVTRLPRRPRR